MWKNSIQIRSYDDSFGHIAAHDKFWTITTKPPQFPLKCSLVVQGDQKNLTIP